jgi:hypothetical protein
MSKCTGLHCNGCHGHAAGKGGAGATVALLALIGLAVTREPKVVHALEIIGYIAAATAGAAIVGTLAFFIIRANRRRRAAAQIAEAYTLSAVVVRPAPPTLNIPYRAPAIESARPAVTWLKRTSRPAIGKPRHHS